MLNIYSLALRIIDWQMPILSRYSNLFDFLFNILRKEKRKRKGRQVIDNNRANKIPEYLYISTSYQLLLMAFFRTESV